MNFSVVALRSPLHRSPRPRRLRPRVPDRSGLPPSVKPGDVFVLRLPAGQPPPEAAFFRDDLRAAHRPRGEGSGLPHRRRSRCVAGAGTILLRRAGGAEERLRVTIEKRAFPEERLTLPPAMVTPPKELEERIAREQALAAEVYRSSGAAKSGTGVSRRRSFRRPPATSVAAGSSTASPRAPTPARTTRHRPGLRSRRLPVARCAWPGTSITPG